MMIIIIEGCGTRAERGALPGGGARGDGSRNPRSPRWPLPAALPGPGGGRRAPPGPRGAPLRCRDGGCERSAVTGKPDSGSRRSPPSPTHLADAGGNAVRTERDRVPPAAARCRPPPPAPRSPPAAAAVSGALLGAVAAEVPGPLPGAAGVPPSPRSRRGILAVPEFVGM